MRAYTVAATAVTLNVPPKWVDNVLSHNHVTGVSRGRQGVARKLSYKAILNLEVALRLARALSTPLPQALEIAARLLKEGSASSSLTLGRGLALSMDLASIETDLAARLDHAVEVAPSPRRGRPATRK
jgi:hypothetical protein